ncbi:NAD-dependent deacetylase [bacterium C-53]|nr:NAD-dependent deacetylase [Lachnospiraceae bacterium]NBI01763.1 NAD-dependent deacetylase [Lachnospiraceae bacterium]RKJ12182.1 NAD-dependent deacetylase [bacterium C-53]
MYNTLEHQIHMARQMVTDHSRIVCLLGVGMRIESGIPNPEGNDIVYYMEEEYGYAPEEIFAASYFYTRPGSFYKAYKDVYLGRDYEPSAAYYRLADLEKQGKLSGCVTQAEYSLAKKAGVWNVVELHGSIYENWCPKCKRRYTKEYLRDQKGTPLCEECKMTIRPGIVLRGEQVRNDYITNAANMISNADMMMVLGTNMNDGLVVWAMNYFRGNCVLEISKNSHFSDNRASLAINAPVVEVLPQIT